MAIAALDISPETQSRILTAAEKFNKRIKRHNTKHDLTMVAIASGSEIR